MNEEKEEKKVLRFDDSIYREKGVGKKLTNFLLLSKGRMAFFLVLIRCNENY